MKTEAISDVTLTLRRAQHVWPSELLPIIPWAEKFVKVFGVKGQRFSSEMTPWTRYPIELADRIGFTRYITFIKPVQSGGSVVGEIAVCRWIIRAFGKIQWNWDTDDFARKRWYERLEKILRSCPPVRSKWPRGGQERFKAQKCLVVFPNVSLDVQGVFDPNSLDSDSVPFKVNEEVHKWKPGHLDKAYRRSTACTFPIDLNISNASTKGDQLYEAFQNGTQQHWEVKCPGCGQYHIMRTRWEDNQPALGGLRYDSAGCRRADGTFDYNRLARSVRYQMPCGFEVPMGDISLRRELSAAGRYSAAFNIGALESDISLTLQAVACHDIDWLQLVKEKHTALRMLKGGDDSAWRKYLQERECIFYDEDEHRPFMGAVVLTESARQNRKGLPNEMAKIWAADWQQGFKHLGELTHYWLCIESVLGDCSSQVIFAGKVSDEAEVLAVLRDHGITDADQGGIYDGFVDASKNTKHILSFCYRAGINAVMGNVSGKGLWKWPDGSWRYFSPKKYIYKELNMPPRFDLILTRDGYVEDAAEPFIMMYSKAGILKNHFFIREMKANVLATKKGAGPDEYIERIVPEDIGEDYLKHMEAWERDPAASAPKGMGQVEGFKQTHRADHLLSCTCYIDLIKDLCGLLGDRLARLGIKPKPEQEHG